MQIRSAVFCAELLTDSQTNRQTDNDDYISSLAELNITWSLSKRSSVCTRRPRKGTNHSAVFYPHVWCLTSLPPCRSLARRSRQITTPAPHHWFLQAGCSSWRPTNSVKAMMAIVANNYYATNPQLPATNRTSGVCALRSSTTAFGGRASHRDGCLPSYKASEGDQRERTSLKTGKHRDLRY